MFPCTAPNLLLLCLVLNASAIHLVFGMRTLVYHVTPCCYLLTGNLKVEYKCKINSNRKTEFGVIVVFECIVQQKFSSDLLCPLLIRVSFYRVLVNQLIQE